MFFTSYFVINLYIFVNLYSHSINNAINAVNIKYCLWIQNVALLVFLFLVLERNENKYLDRKHYSKYYIIFKSFLSSSSVQNIN